MKRCIARLLAVMLVFSLSGCIAFRDASPTGGVPADPGTAEPEKTEYTDDTEDTVSPDPGEISDLSGSGEPDTPNDAFFDGALFIGDSIMEGIRQYTMKMRREQPTLGDAKFLTATVGISLADLTGDRQEGRYYLYKGKEMPLADIAADAAPRRIFLLLGLNDLAAADPVIEACIDRYGRVIDLLKAAVPDAEIVVITNPPKAASAWLPDYTENRDFDNALIDAFVGALTALCETRGIPVVDAHGPLENESGALPDEFCRDGYVHLNDAGAAAVVDELYAFAAGKK